MSWNIFSIFLWHMEIIKWHGEIFYYVTSMGHSKINNGLLTLNMGLAKKVVNNRLCDHLKANKIEGCILSSLVQPMFQMSNVIGQ
jgi:hypothetical protein